MGSSFGGGAERYDARQQSTGFSQMGGGGSFGGGAGRSDVKSRQGESFTPKSRFQAQGFLQRMDQTLTGLRQMQDAAEKDWLPAMEKRAARS